MLPLPVVDENRPWGSACEHCSNCLGHYNLIQNSQAVKKSAALKKGYGEKRCEIQGGGQEMAVIVG